MGLGGGQGGLEEGGGKGGLSSGTRVDIGHPRTPVVDALGALATLGVLARTRRFIFHVLGEQLLGLGRERAPPPLFDGVHLITVTTLPLQGEPRLGRARLRAPPPLCAGVHLTTVHTLHVQGELLVRARERAPPTLFAGVDCEYVRVNTILVKKEQTSLRSHKITVLAGVCHRESVSV